MRSGEYRGFLVANGYQLAEVERVIVSAPGTRSSGEGTEPESDDTGEETEPDTGEDADSDQQSR